MIELLKLFFGILCAFGAVLIFGVIGLWFGCSNDNDKDP